MDFFLCDLMLVGRPKAWVGFFFFLRAGLRMRIQTEDPGKAVLYVSVGKACEGRRQVGAKRGKKKNMYVERENPPGEGG